MSDAEFNHLIDDESLESVESTSPALVNIYRSLESINSLVNEYLDNDSIALVEGLLISEDELGNTFYIIPSSFKGPFPTIISEKLSEMEDSLKLLEDSENSEQIKSIRKGLSNVRFIYKQVSRLNDILVSLSNLLPGQDNLGILTDFVPVYNRPRIVDYLIMADKVCRKLQANGFVGIANRAWDKMDRVIRLLSEKNEDEIDGLNWEEYVLISTEIMVESLEDRDDLIRLKLSEVSKIIERLDVCRLFVNENEILDWTIRHNLMLNSLARSLGKRLAHLRNRISEIENKETIIDENDEFKLRNLQDKLNEVINVRSHMLTTQLIIPTDLEMGRKIVTNFIEWISQQGLRNFRER